MGRHTQRPEKPHRKPCLWSGRLPGTAGSCSPMETAACWALVPLLPLILCREKWASACPLLFGRYGHIQVAFCVHHRLCALLSGSSRGHRRLCGGEAAQTSHLKWSLSLSKGSALIFFHGIYHHLTLNHSCLCLCILSPAVLEALQWQSFSVLFAVYPHSSGNVRWMIP